MQRRLGMGVQGGNAEPPERSPAALLVQSKAEQNTLFLD